MRTKKVVGEKCILMMEKNTFKCWIKTPRMFLFAGKRKKKEKLEHCLDLIEKKKHKKCYPNEFRIPKMKEIERSSFFLQKTRFYSNSLYYSIIVEIDVMHFRDRDRVREREKKWEIEAN